MKKHCRVDHVLGGAGSERQGSWGAVRSGSSNRSRGRERPACVLWSVLKCAGLTVITIVQDGTRKNSQPDSLLFTPRPLPESKPRENS